MNRVVLFFAPGLCASLLKEEAMPWLASLQDSRHRAELVPSFPCLPAIVIHCALTGRTPAAHGRVLARDPATATGHDPLRFALTAGTPLGRPQLQILEDGRILEAARDEGLHSPSRLSAARELDAILRELREGSEAEGLLLVLGLPGARPVDERIVWENLARTPACEVTAESAILRIRCPHEATLEGLREDLLRLSGVERVLRGEGLSAFGVDDEQGQQLLALARSGFSFEDECASVGSPDCAPGEEGVLLALGSENPRAWPPKLHDFRLAPSVAAYLGLSHQGYPDRPFPL